MLHIRAAFAVLRAANKTTGDAMLVAAQLASAAIASPVRADPLTFDGAIARARANAPSLRAKALGADATRAVRRAAGALPDPKLSLGIDSFPISGPLAFRPRRDDFTWVDLQRTDWRRKAGCLSASHP